MTTDISIQASFDAEVALGILSLGNPSKSEVASILAEISAAGAAGIQFLVANMDEIFGNSPAWVDDSIISIVSPQHEASPGRDTAILLLKFAWNQPGRQDILEYLRGINDPETNAAIVYLLNPESDEIDNDVWLLACEIAAERKLIEARDFIVEKWNFDSLEAFEDDEIIRLDQAIIALGDPGRSPDILEDFLDDGRYRTNFIDWVLAWLTDPAHDCTDWLIRWFEKQDGSDNQDLIEKVGKMLIEKGQDATQIMMQFGLKKLASTDVVVRLEACQLFGKNRQVEAYDQLLRLITPGAYYDHSSTVRIGAIEALYQIDPLRALPEIWKYLGQTSSIEPVGSIRSALWGTLSLENKIKFSLVCLPKDDGAGEARNCLHLVDNKSLIVAILQELMEAEQISRRAARYALELLFDGVNIKKLINHLDSHTIGLVAREHPGWSIRLTCTEQLLKIDQAVAIPTLLSIIAMRSDGHDFAETDYDVRHAAIVALGEIGTKKTEPQLRILLQSEDHDENITEILKIFKKWGIVPKLRESLTMLQSQVPQHRRIAIQVIKVAADPKVVIGLVRTIEYLEKHEAIEVIEIIADLGDRTIIGKLRGVAIHSKEPTIRVAAIDAIITIMGRPPTAMPESE